MRISLLLSLLFTPLFVLAQNNTSSSSQSQQVHLSTTLSQVVTFGPGRVLTTSTQAIVVTITSSASAPAASGNSTGNSTTSGNSTTNANATTTTTSSPLPTAPTSIDGGGDNAPVPGATAPGGIYGPDDSYTSTALALKRNALLVGLAGVIIGGALILL